MSRNAALLIDLENFYLARESTAGAGLDEPYDFTQDLERLCGFARGLVGEQRRLIVRRAYADFSASRINDDATVGRPRREYYLRSIPTVLMEQGIEPVQVFRFPGGSSRASKNAADMRLAMDAIGLIANVDFFIVVTGDKDFIPVILELRQRAAFVVGLGAHGSVARTLTAYCDEFHEFESLTAAEEHRETDERGLDGARAPLHEAEARPHSIALYRRLLMAPGRLRLNVHDYGVWSAITEHVFEAATNPDGSAAVVFHHELRSSVIDHFADEGLYDAGKSANDALFLIFKAGCFVCADPGPRQGQTDFNWTNHGARLAPEITSAGRMRQHAYAFTVDRLIERVRDYDGRRPEPELVAGLLFGADAGEDEAALARQMLASGGAGPQPSAGDSPTK